MGGWRGRRRRGRRRGRRPSSGIYRWRSHPIRQQERPPFTAPLLTGHPPPNPRQDIPQPKIPTRRPSPSNRRAAPGRPPPPPPPPKTPSPPAKHPHRHHDPKGRTNHIRRYRQEREHGANARRIEWSDEGGELCRIEKRHAEKPRGGREAVRGGEKAEVVGAFRGRWHGAGGFGVGGEDEDGEGERGDQAGSHAKDLPAWRRETAFARRDEERAGPVR